MFESTTSLNNTGIRCGMLYNMMQVETNAFDVGVFGSDPGLE